MATRARQPTARDLLDRLRRPLELEANQGYRNDAVVGRTISVYAREWAERVAGLLPALAAPARELADTLSGYDDAAPAERQALIRGALTAASEIRVSEQPAVPVRTARRAATPATVHRTAGPRAAPRRPTSLDDSHPALRDGGKPWAAAVRKLGLETPRDLLFYFPRDYMPVKRMADIQDGERVAAVGAAGERRHETMHRGLMQYILEVSDGTGTVTLHSFARRGARRGGSGWSPLTLMYSPGTRLLIEGAVNRWGSLIEMQYQGVQRLKAGEDIPLGTMLPLYPLTEGLYQTNLRSLIWECAEEFAGRIPDPLPDAVRAEFDLPALADALRAIHRPTSEAERDQARRRLAFEEFFVLQVALALRRAERSSDETGLRLASDQDILQVLGGLLPFPLTESQTRVVQEVAADLASPRATMRLIQGDVGSGKTVVALAALLIAVRAGYQAALMAPTELLATQHHLILSHFLQRAGVTPRLLIGALSPAESLHTRAEAASGAAPVVIGTHALIEEATTFKNLGLVIVDEQHRFGVLQRAALRRKGQNPEVLVMSATPIPRSLAMTLYGDLDLSLIDSLPPGRRPVATFWGPMEKMDRAWAFVREHLQRDRQAYVVCPLVEESERLEVEAATQVYEQLRDTVFADFGVGLVHGRLPAADRDAVMAAFRRNAIQVLCSTSVIEVGIDVPNATVIVILNAERFGLSQLHQLRGRVGRAAHKSACLVLSEEKYNPQLEALDPADPARGGRERMRLIVNEADGFRIAEADLSLRGPGDFMGARQHGLPDFRVARLDRDFDLLKQARDAAFRLVESDPRLETPDHQSLAAAVRSLRKRIEPATPHRPRAARAAA